MRSSLWTQRYCPDLPLRGPAGRRSPARRVAPPGPKAEPWPSAEQPPHQWRQPSVSRTGNAREHLLPCHDHGREAQD
eukprot:9500987-Alexandrium_andersonii.AAC.1